MNNLERIFLLRRKFRYLCFRPARFCLFPALVFCLFDRCSGILDTLFPLSALFHLLMLTIAFLQCPYGLHRHILLHICCHTVQKHASILIRHQTVCHRLCSCKGDLQDASSRSINVQIPVKPLS